MNEPPKICEVCNHSIHSVDIDKCKKCSYPDRHSCLSELMEKWWEYQSESKYRRNQSENMNEEFNEFEDFMTYLGDQVHTE
jgi:hypothetical protein